MGAPAPATTPFDAFLSYHSTDLDVVAEIAAALNERQINVWWDQWHLPPGWSFQQKIDDGLRNCGSTVVVLGPTGLGEWQKKEIEAAMVLGSRLRHPVIPVFLPNTMGQIQVPTFLETHGAVIFRQSVAEKAGLDRLIWGITGVNPNAPSRGPRQQEAAPALLNPVEEAATELVAWLKEFGGVTFFLGGGATGESSETPPQGYEITRALLRLLSQDPDGLKVLPPVDFAATYFAAGKDEAILEATVIQLIQNRSGTIPKTHQRLVELIPRIRRIPPRGRRSFKQLIFTTNLDLMMERALIRGGIEFSRLVQHRSDARVYVTEYRDIPDWSANRGAGTDDYLQSRRTEPRPSESVVLENLREPVLYKFRGSEDIPDSPVLTSSQYYEFAKAVLRNRIVPEGIESILSNTVLVFLGCGLLDPDVRLSQHTVLSEPLKSSHQKYLVQLPPGQDRDDPNRQLELGIWNRIKERGVERRIKTVEARSDEFLNLLRERLSL